MLSAARISLQHGSTANSSQAAYIYQSRFALIRAPNHALERSVRGLARGAAGATESLAPATPGRGIARPAQRRR